MSTIVGRIGGFAGGLLALGAAAVAPLQVERPFGASGPERVTLSSRTQALGLRIDRDEMQIVGRAFKARPYLRSVELAGPQGARNGVEQIEVRLLDPAGREHVERIDVPGLCLRHPASAEPHVEGDTIRLHRETILVELPDLAGFDIVEAAYYEDEPSGLTRRSLGERELASAEGEDFLAAQVLWPESFSDPEIYQVYGVEAEGAKRINVVIVPDGYTYAQKGLMQAHAAELVEHFRARTPYAQHDPFFNYILVYAYSPQSGADECDCGTIVNSAMGTRFPASNPECGSSDNRCLYYGGGCDTNGESNIVAAELRAPFKDVTIVMVNTPRYGGCGGSRSVYSAANASAVEIAVHELGHTLAGLADEYTSSSSCGSGAGEINTSTDPVDGAWPEWIGVLGAPQQGGQYYQQCVYRPLPSCEMRSLGQPFCPVCNQRWSLVTFGHPKVSPTAPIAAMSPPAALVAYVGVPVSFSVETRLSSGAGVTNEMTWTARPAGGLPLVIATGTTSLVHAFQQPVQHTVTAKVVADTNFVKPEKYGANRDTVVWTVDVQVLAVPAEVSSLVFLGPASLDWSNGASAFTYNLYRGDLTGLASGDYGDCLEAGLAESQTQDLDSPPPGAAWFYLVAGKNPLSEGPLGTDSSGAPRTASEPCAE